MNKTLYLIGGPMGGGKTAVCRQLRDDLPRSVFLDGDWCWDAHPFQVTEETKAMVLDNICHLLGNFLGCSAYDHVIFGWVLDRQSTLDAILAPLDTARCRVVSVSLPASPSTLRARLEGDVARGVRTPDVIGRSLKRLPLYRELSTVKIPTDGKTIREVAQAIQRL